MKVREYPLETIINLIFRISFIDALPARWKTEYRKETLTSRCASGAGQIQVSQLIVRIGVAKTGVSTDSVSGRLLLSILYVLVLKKVLSHAWVVSFSEDDCTILLAVRPGVQATPDRKISEVIFTRLGYAQYSYAPKRGLGMASETSQIIERGVATLLDETWEQARRRTEVISPLAALEVVGHRAADAAALALGGLIRRAREGAGLVTDLAPARSGGGRGKGRLSESVERIIGELLQKAIPDQTEAQSGGIPRKVVHACKVQKLPVPARNTIALRIARLDPDKTIRSREGLDGARDLQGVGGVPPTITAPWSRYRSTIRSLT